LTGQKFGVRSKTILSNVVSGSNFDVFVITKAAYCDRHVKNHALTAMERPYISIFIENLA